ncbi:MAG TPA: PQQ-binding-like beta-propeller repeat protein [Pirellulales bacterium]|nr:PQQ-binding-like beta-propeller repeat protein [Pirellulales bacterium]
MRHILLGRCYVALVVAVATSFANAQEWTRFRGPNGSGYVADELPAKWTEQDYNWRVELPGIGHSSPVIWHDKIFLTSAVEESAERIVLCLDADTGNIRWERRFTSSVHTKHLRNSFASSTPAVDKDHVYTTWSTPDDYIVLALDHNGRDAWRVDLGPVVSQHSTGTSPVVFNDMLVLGNDQDGPIKENPASGVSFLVALDCRDGHQRWRTPRENAVVSYSTPCVYQPKGGKPQLIFNSQAHGITSIDPATGKVNWEVGVFDKRAVSSPIVVGNLIFGTTGSGGGGSYVAAVRAAPKPELAYKIAEMAPYVPTLVARDKLLFLWSDKGIVSCVDAATGKTHWRERVGGNYSGSPIIAGKKLYCIAEDGTVVVVAAEPKYALLGENPLGEDSRSTPSVSDGRMYLRTYSHLVSLGKKK